MKRAKFEEKCSLAKLKIVGSKTFDGVYVVVADGYSNGAYEMPKPHYRTIYAIGPDSEKLCIMQSIYHELGKGLGMMAHKKIRVKDAYDQAKSAIGILKHGGLLKSH